MNLKPIDTGLSALHPAHDASPIGRAKPASDDQKIAESSRQFEAMLVRQVLAETLKPSSATGGAAAPGSDIYQSFVTDIVADDISKGSSLGVAHMLQSQIQSGSAKPHASTSQPK